MTETKLIVLMIQHRKAVQNKKYLDKNWDSIKIPTAVKHQHRDQWQEIANRLYNQIEAAFPVFFPTINIQKLAEI